LDIITGFQVPFLELTGLLEPSKAEGAEEVGKMSLISDIGLLLRWQGQEAKIALNK
jgi:hypothetical protein